MADRLILLCESCEHPSGLMQVQVERDPKLGGIAVRGYRCLVCEHVSPAWPTQGARVVGKVAA